MPIPRPRALVRASAAAVVRAQAQPVQVARRFNQVLEESAGKQIDEGVLLDALDRMQPATTLAPGSMERMVRAADISGYLGGPVPPTALVPRPG